MSHEIESNDGLVLARGEPAWHGLGTVIQGSPTVPEALQIARMDYDILSLPLTAARRTVGWGDNGPTEANETIKVETHVAQVRSDDGSVLGVVGAGYTTVQNRELAALVIDAAGSEGVTIESAGTLRGGRDVFFLAHLDTFQIGARDKSHVYALFTNSHDGTGALRVLPTSIRVVCQNTRRAALSGKESRALTVSERHTSNLRDRMEDVRRALRGAAAVAAHVKEEAEALAARSMTKEQVSAFFASYYAAEYGALPVGPYLSLSQGDKAKRTRAVDMAEVWHATLRQETDAMGTGPSAWLAANAITRWIDHDRTIRGGDRTHSNLMGSAADAKDKVFSLAAAL